jgi:S-formylglutathione hydrolase FrmB
MRTRSAALALALASLAMAAPAQAADAGLVNTDTAQLSPRLQELTFTTPALDAPTKVRVLLPENYDASGLTRYPVLYLLHGSFGDQTDWTVKGDAANLTAPYPLIVVMPETGSVGNYSDWYNYGRFGTPMWETFHIGQLLPWIDAHYPTDGTREGRAVAGLSMGGHGSMGYAARHPDLFAAAGSFSGAVDTNNLFVQPLTANAGPMMGKPLDSVYGPRATEEVRWRGDNPVDLAQNLRGMFLQVDTGDGGAGGPGGDSGDPVEADVYQMSVAFHRRLDELGIPHIWNYYGPGGHTWYYWSRDLRQFLPRMMDAFAGAKPPATFDYTAIEPAYDVFGWHVAIDRPALEFSELRGAGRGGFSLSGSGKAQMTTAPYWTPGTLLTVTTENGKGTTTQSLPADAAGRLSLPLTLGPANPEQQYSPNAAAWMATTRGWDDTGRFAEEIQKWPVYTTHVTITPPAPARVAAFRRAMRLRSPHRGTRRHAHKAPVRKR